MPAMNRIHDRGYKKLFSNKTIFRQLLETFVHEDWVKDLDFETCETIDKSFVSDHYKETESDLIYKLRLRGREVFIVILLEFQSTVDRFMALRIANYITNFYMDYMQSNKHMTLLPPVFPVMLYNGDRDWNAPLNVSDLIQDADLLGKYALNCEYFKIVEHEYGKEQLLSIRNIVSTLFLTETHYDINLLKEEFVAVFERETDRQAASLLLNWFEQLFRYQRIEASDFTTLSRHVYRNSREVKTMLETLIKEDRKQIYKKGRQESRQEIARAMLKKGMALALIAEITQLTEQEIREILAGLSSE